MSDTVSTADRRRATLNSAWQLILSRSTDMSHSIITEPVPVQLVPRIHGWNPLPTLRASAKTNGCPLCTLPQEQAFHLWFTYGHEKSILDVVKAAQDFGIADINAQVVRRHFGTHYYVQPPPNKRLSEEGMLEVTNGLTARERNIIIAVWRNRMLSTRQISELFFMPETKNYEAQKKSAYRSMHKLRFSHCLYQYRGRQQGRGTEVYYFLGRWGAPYVQQYEGWITQDRPWVSQPTHISEYFMNHDLAANDMFITMRKQLYTNRDADNLIEVDGQKLPLSLPTDSWWGSRCLHMEYTNPLTSTVHKIIPDAFAALSFNDGRHRQFRLPMFLEWDTGVKPIEETAAQMIAYSAFALSGAIGKRFPQLDVHAYCPPILLVTSSPYRTEKITNLIRGGLTASAPDRIPGMFITDAESFKSGAWQPGVWRSPLLPDVRDIVDHSLAQALLNANKRLVDEAPIHWRAPMEFNPNGAKHSNKPPMM